MALHIVNVASATCTTLTSSESTTFRQERYTFGHSSTLSPTDLSSIDLVWGLTRDVDGPLLDVEKALPAPQRSLAKKISCAPVMSPYPILGWG